MAPTATADATRMLSGLLQRRRPRRSDDAQLEHALLRLCAALDASPAAALAQLLALDAKCWRRLALLLFASDAALVRALAALLARVAQRPEAAADALRLRLWRSSWRGHLRDKLLDCGAEAGLAPRLLRVLGASLRAGVCCARDDDLAAALAALELLLTLSVAVERSPRVAQAAAHELRRLLQLDGQALLAPLRSHTRRSGVWRQYAAWLLGAHGSEAAAARCSQAYLALLATAAAVPPSAGRAAYGGLLDDAAAMLRICSRGLESERVGVQLAALQLLETLLARGDAGVALCSAVRLSGGLLSLSWLLAHERSAVAAAAASTLELAIARSPPRDVLRALLEQGCLVLWCALDDASSSARCRRLLHWATRQVARQTSVVAACVHAVLGSSNARLQRNLVLTLQLLAPRSAAVREALERLHFRSHALPQALQTDEHGELAAALLAAALACCDRCSALKMDAQTAQLEPKHEALAASRRLESVSPSAARLLRLVASQSASQAAQTLAHEPRMETLLELLQLAQACDSTRGWHAATAAVCGRLTRANWLQVLQFACERVRHPTLVLRSVRFALRLRHRDARSATGQRRPQSAAHELDEDEDEDEARETHELVAGLRLAAVQLGQELFAG